MDIHSRVNNRSRNLIVLHFCVPFSAISAPLREIFFMAADLHERLFGLRICVWQLGTDLTTPGGELAV